MSAKKLSKVILLSLSLLVSGSQAVAMDPVSMMAIGISVSLLKQAYDKAYAQPQEKSGDSQSSLEVTKNNEPKEETNKNN